MNIKLLLSALIFGLSLGFFSATATAADLAPPQATIEDTSERLKVQLQDPSFAHDFQRVTQFVNQTIYPHVDFDLISAMVLGKLWKQATPEQKDSFKKEFQTLLIRTYSRALFELQDWSVRFLPLNMAAGDKTVMVKTEILQPAKQPIALDYAMANINGDWKVYDFVIEGVSLINQYRASFKYDAERSSLQSVIDQLAKKNSDALNNNASSKG